MPRKFPAYRLPSRLTKFTRSEDAWVTPFSLIMISATLSMIGVAIDYVNYSRVKAELQTASDAVALAATSQLPSMTDAESAGLLIAGLYFDTEDTLTTITSSDIEFGDWDADGETFTSNTTSPSAVRVIAHNTSARGNLVESLLTTLTTTDGYELTTTSVARTNTTSTNLCESGGFLSSQWIVTGSNNQYDAGFCTYGEQGVDILNNNSYAGNNSIQGGALASFVQGNSNACDSSTCTMNLADASEPAKSIALPNEVNALYSALPTGDTMGFLDGGSYTIRNVSKLPRRNQVQSNSIYVVSGNASFQSNGNYSDLIVVASGSISAGSNTTFDNVLFVTPDSIQFGSNTQFGMTDYCGDGRFQTYLFAGIDINFGSNNSLRGVQMAAQGEIEFGSNVGAIGDVHAEAWGDIIYNSNNDLSNCETPLTSDFGWQSEIIDDQVLSASLVY